MVGGPGWYERSLRARSRRARDNGGAKRRKVSATACTATALLLVLAVSLAGCTTAIPEFAPADIEADVKLPQEDGSLRFAVMGDTGTGDSAQYRVAGLMAIYHKAFPFELVLMLGDNLYGGEAAGDYERKFEVPYKPLLDAGVKFYASLGNHDDRPQRLYENFNMGGELYYSFSPAEDVRFFALYSDYLDPEQVRWLEEELAESTERWKICFFHHPLYSSGGRHGPSLELRAVLEPLFVTHGVDVVFSGHEHFYERLLPQNGITYFTSGAGGKLRAGDVQASEQTAAKYDDGRSFMVLELVGDDLHFQVISASGTTVDLGVVENGNKVTQGSR